MRARHRTAARRYAQVATASETTPTTAHTARSTEHERPVGVRPEGPREGLHAVRRRQQVAREPHRLRHPVGRQHAEQQRRRHAQLARAAWRVPGAGASSPSAAPSPASAAPASGMTAASTHRWVIGSPKSSAAEDGGDERPRHGEGRVRARRAQHHRGGRHRQRGVVVEAAAGPQLAEVLGEQVQRDEGDDEHRRPGDHGPRLGAAVDDAAHQDHDPDRLEGRHEQQRDPGDPRPGQLRPVHGGQRRPQPRARRRGRRARGAGAPRRPGRRPAGPRRVRHSRRAAPLASAVAVLASRRAVACAAPYGARRSCSRLHQSLPCRPPPSAR